MGCGFLEDLAVVRAVEGLDEPVFWQGEECGAVRRYYHLEFLLKGAMPEKYREKHEHTVKGDVSLKFQGEMTELLALYARTVKELEDTRSA
jgi:hypothetical protein